MARQRFRQAVFGMQAQAVKMIQSRYRGVRAKSRTQHLRREKVMNDRENSAATTLQSVLRGKEVRKQQQDADNAV
jgi:hypothetical protein